jgi:peptidoglycan-associated lipoprotein
MPHSNRLAIAAALMFAGVLGGCHSKPPQATPAPATTQQSNDDSDRLARARADSAARAEAARRAREDSIAAARAAERAEQASMRATLIATIEFEFDAAELQAGARAALDAKIRILTANPTVTLRIAGHTDERGSDEYNLALGQRRAAAAMRYLVQHGLAANRFETISYGEEHPVAAGHDESAWCQNRRAEFDVTSTTVLKRP